MVVQELEKPQLNNGYNKAVSITGRDKSKLDRVASEINAIPIHLDVTKLITLRLKF